VELEPSGDLYQYNGSEGGYDYITGPNTEGPQPLAGFVNISGGLLPPWCATITMPGGGGIGDWCPDGTNAVLHLGKLPAPIKSTKQLQERPNGCVVTSLTMIPVPATRDLRAEAWIECKPSNGNWYFDGSLQLQRGYTLPPTHPEWEMRGTSPTFGFVRVPANGLRLQLTIRCQSYAGTALWIATVRGYAKDITDPDSEHSVGGNTPDAIELSPYDILGGCK
jgi:hypothetical protein